MTDTITRNGELAVPVPSGLHFLPHQREGITFAVNRLRTHRGAMFGDVMGLGKTIEAIGTANVLGPRRILVVCPASMLFTWWREIRTWQTLGLRVFLIQAGRDVADNHRLLEAGVDGWFIINYDILRNYPEAKSDRPWDLVILDESHKLKNPGASRTQHVFGSDTIAPIAAQKALLLTGTPMANYVHDLYTQLNYLDPGTWPSFKQFVDAYYAPGYKIIDPSQVVGEERNLERLRRQLASVMIRRSKSVLNLPPKEREIVTVAVDDDGFWPWLGNQSRSLNRLQRQLMNLLDGATTIEIRLGIQDLQAKIHGIISNVRYQVGMAKLPAVIRYLRGCTGKTLVFAYHHDVIESLMEALADRGMSGFTGASTLRDRDRAANRFQKEPNRQFFVGNIEAAGQGITLTAARHVVFAEPDWRGTYLEQAEDRAHRIGQTEPVQVTYLLLDQNAWSTDSWMDTKVKDKQVVIDAVLGSLDDVSENLWPIQQRSATGRFLALKKTSRGVR